MHRASLAELDGQDGDHIFRLAMQVAKAIRHSGVRCDGISLHLADGAVAGHRRNDTPGALNWITWPA